MHSLLDGPNSYRVEVSGWNVKGIFFVEQAMLHWTDVGEKSIELISRLREGCVVFVRLIHATTGNINFPVAYRVLNIACDDLEGRGCVSLRQLHPHIDAGQDAIGTSNSASKSRESQKVLAN
jgi:hypothetical protein